MTDEIDTRSPEGPQTAGPCRQWSKTLAATHPEDVSPALLAQLSEHLKGCPGCQMARHDYLFMDAVVPQAVLLHAADEPKAMTQLLSSRAIAGLRSVLAIRPPTGIPPRVQRLVDEELRLKSLESLSVQEGGQRFDGDPGEPPAHEAAADEAVAGSAVARLPDSAASSISAKDLQVIHHGLPTAEPTIGIRSGINIPDDMSWREESGYSIEVADAVTHAYQRIKAHDYETVYALLTPQRARLMSVHQRMCVGYALSQAAAAQNEYHQAVAFLDESLELAIHLNDPGACVLLTYLHGAISYTTQQFYEAAEFYDVALEFLGELGQGVRHVDPSLELEALLRLSTCCFLMEQYDRANDVLAKARRLTPLTNQYPQDAAALEWIAALLYRWSGSPERALRHAMASSEVFATVNHIEAFARIQLVVAETSLDLAASYPTGAAAQSHDAFLSMAQPYVNQALSLMQDAQDEPGKELAMLSYARLTRMMNNGVSCVAITEQVVQHARHLGDKPLLAQAYTTLGNEMMMSGEVDSALHCYRETLDIVHECETPAYGVWARRGLLRAGEMS